MTSSTINRRLAGTQRSILDVGYAEQADVMFSATAARTALCGYAILLGWAGQAVIPGLGAADLTFANLLTFPSTIPADMAGVLAPIGVVTGLRDGRSKIQEEQDVIFRIYRLLYIIFNVAADCYERDAFPDDYRHARQHIKTLMAPTTVDDTIDRIIRAYSEYRKNSPEGQYEHRVWARQKALNIFSSDNSQYRSFLNPVIENPFFERGGSFRQFCKRTNVDQQLKREDKWNKCEVARKTAFNLPGLAFAGYGLYSITLKIAAVCCGAAIAATPVGAGLIIGGAAIAITIIAAVCFARASKAQMNRNSCMYGLINVIEKNLFPRERINEARVPANSQVVAGGQQTQAKVADRQASSSRVRCGCW